MGGGHRWDLPEHLDHRVHASEHLMCDEEVGVTMSGGARQWMAHEEVEIREPLGKAMRK